MFDSKFLCTLAALIVTVITICNVTPAEGDITEKFHPGPVTTTKKLIAPPHKDIKIDGQVKLSWNPNGSLDHEKLHYDSINNDITVTNEKTLNKFGNEVDTVMYKREIYSMKKHRNSAHGDKIRGDLEIAPCNTGWFQVSADDTHLVGGYIHQHNNNNA